MKHLYLIRHAKSSWSDPRLADFDRPLNKRGKRDAPFMGKRLASASISFDLMVSSSAKRARKTARKIAQEVAYDKDQIIFTPEIYTSDLRKLVTVIRNTDNAIKAMALVGHNFVITECAEWLTGTYIDNIPTSGIVAITFDVETWGEIDHEKGKLLFFDYPKLHGDRGVRG